LKPLLVSPYSILLFLLSKQFVTPKLFLIINSSTIFYEGKEIDILFKNGHQIFKKSNQKLS